MIIVNLPGFGYLSSLFLAISIDGIERFARLKQLASYLGVKTPYISVRQVRLRINSSVV